MRKFILFFSLLFLFRSSSFSQYADLGTGTLKNQIWWFDWNGFNIANGASKTITTADGLTATITFSNVQGPVFFPNIMNTWYGSVLHFLYDFSDPTIKPALFSPYTTQNSRFTITVTAIRNGLPATFKFIAADAEASALSEVTTLTVAGGNSWYCIDFFRNSSQTSNPFGGCNTIDAIITDTYSGSSGIGQNPVIATDATSSGSISIDCFFNRSGVDGQMGIAFGIFGSVDRGDLPASYGSAQHTLAYTTANPCNYLPPLPATTLIQNLKIGSIAGDADPVQTTDDNAAGADEDGIASFPDYTNNGSYSLNVNLQNTTGNNAYLTGWFDYNRNGVFENNEYVTNTIPNNATSSVLTWTGLPTNLPAGSVTDCGFRFRLSSNITSTQSPTGFASDGEVEDYLEDIIPNTTFANFLLPDTICVNTPVNITNTSSNATTYYWNFCSGSLNSTPAGSNFASPNLSMPVFMDIVQEGINYYVFVCNHTGSLSRMDFGNSLLNTPVITDLGSFGGIIPWQVEGIEIQKDGNNWIGYIIGGQYGNSRLVKLNFGASVANTPTVTNLGNVGGLDYPVDFTLIKDGANWFGFTVSADNNTVTRYSFGNSLNNTPVAVNLGNIGGLNYPVGLFLLKDVNNYHLFITNRNGNSISRLDFGTSVANNPTGINLGNPGNNFNWPRDITVIKDCDKTFGFVTNEGTNAITRLDFNNNILSLPTTNDLGNIGNLNFPSSISEIFRTGDAVNFFAPNVNSNSVSRITFNNCNSSSIPSHSGATPPAFQYSQPGEYNISLFVDDGLPTQSVLCKKIVVLDSPPFDFEYKINPCNPLSVEFIGVGNTSPNSFWSFGNGNTTSGITNTSHTYLSPGSYVVKYTIGSLLCPDTITKTINIVITNEDIILTPDTTICAGSLKQLRTSPSLNFCWTPTAYLDDSNSPNPVTSTPNDITYYFTAQTTGTNLIVNGDFSQGNTGFISEYTYASTNTTEGQYFVGTNPSGWNGAFYNCGDHTSLNGNMMIVNAVQAVDVNDNVWEETLSVLPNTNYAFSTWILSLTPANPAQVQFSINGKNIGGLINAVTSSCNWAQFYTTWNSGNSTTAVISIVNKMTIPSGNDFALDDISFAPVFIKRDSVMITVEKPIVKTSDDATVCAGDPVQLNTIGASAYLWTPITGLSDTGIANPIATPQVTTEYIVTGTTLNGCAAKDTVNITVNSKPVINKSNDITICKNSSTQLFAGGGITYTWTPDVTLDNPSISNPVASPTTNTTYYVIVADTYCSNNDSIKVNIRPDPVFMVSSSAPVCQNQSIQLNASGGDIYSWDHPADLNNASISNPIANPQSTTTYSVQITDTVCINSATLSTIITVLSPPTVIANKSNDIDCTESFSELNVAGAATYEWTPSAGLNNNLIYNPTANPQVTTVYSVKGTDNNGCINYDSVVVKVSATNKSGYYMPTAFTPNRDGLNDCYGIKYWGVIESLEFSIYNRWGERIFFTKNPNTCWDGIYKGTMQDIGVYVYMIKAKTLCGDTFKKGVFTLAR